jgi:quinol monooxygenase YgiN
MSLFTMKMNTLTEKHTEFLQTVQPITALIGNEKGCLSCNAFQDLENDNSFCLINAWETQDDLDRHIRSDRFSVLLGARTLLSRPPDVAIHAVSSTTGMEVVRAARRNNKGGDYELVKNE